MVYHLPFTLLKFPSLWYLNFWKSQNFGLVNSTIFFSDNPCIVHLHNILICLINLFFCILLAVLNRFEKFCCFSTYESIFSTLYHISVTTYIADNTAFFMYMASNREIENRYISLNKRSNHVLIVLQQFTCLNTRIKSSCLYLFCFPFSDRHIFFHRLKNCICPLFWSFF